MNRLTRLLTSVAVAGVLFSPVYANATEVNKQVIINPDGSMAINKSINGLGTAGTVNKNVVIGAPGSAGAVNVNKTVTTGQTYGGNATINKNVQINQGTGAAVGATGAAVQNLGAQVRTMGNAIQGTRSTTQGGGTIQSHEITNTNAGGTTIINKNVQINQGAAGTATINKNVTIDPSVYNGGGVVVNKSATITSTAPAKSVVSTTNKTVITANPVPRPKMPVAPAASTQTTIQGTTTGNVQTLNKQVVISPGAATGQAINTTRR